MSGVSPADPLARLGADGPRGEPPATTVGGEAVPAGEGRAGRAILVQLAAAGLICGLGGAWLWAIRGPTVFVDMLASALAMCF